ncbi:hypothetical protein ATZ36_05735 [Candidatus Endomicrobiellum trichonymphae]|uniref:Fe-containing alcohol dehydrogenase-like C-terminal domain-containing protein n=1 Tax=Endomicrobium trichonymphae TaxID=1408204 RepID=A0A1E5IIE8_ENDTX|nr:hypothetical protein ATZ36_05735 [Candidatus Endomicrobium trichonymphae]
MIFKYLPRSYAAGKDDPVAKEKVHYASTLAGMAFANAFLGLCHSVAHKLGAAFSLSHGIANALVINQVIRYNATENPGKQAVFPQYKFPNTKAKYGQIADELNLGGGNDDEKVDLLINAITQLKKDIQIPLSIKDAGVSEKDFYDKLDGLVDQAFDDQCTGANPVYPLMVDIKNIFIKAYNGEI